MSEQEPYMPSIPELQEAWISTYARDGQLTESAIIQGQREFKRFLAAHDAEVARAAAEKAWDEGQKSGMRHTDRMRAAYEIGRPELPGPPSPNPYRLEQTDEQ